MKKLKIYGMMVVAMLGATSNVSAFALGDSQKIDGSVEVSSDYSECANTMNKANELISNAINLELDEREVFYRASCRIEDNIEMDKQIAEQLAKEKALEEKRKRIEAERKAAEEEARHWRTDTFRITAYCNCSICCGKWADGVTASGAGCSEGTTIAVDPNIIPLGSRVDIDGHTYIAQDTGSAIKGNRIDVFISDHKRASDFGVRYATVKYRVD